MGTNSEKQIKKLRSGLIEWLTLLISFSTGLAISVLFGVRIEIAIAAFVGIVLGTLREKIKLNLMHKRNTRL